MKIHSLGYIGINSSNTASWRQYGTQVLGMMDVSDDLAGDTDSVYLKMDDRPFRIVVNPADTDGYAFSGWEIAGPDAFAAALESLDAAGISYSKGDETTVAARRVQELASFADPQGNRHEIYWGPVSDFAAFASPVGIKHFVTGDQGFGHVVLPAPKFDECLTFYKYVMGFDLSDLMKVKFSDDPAEPEKRLFFMHCNERHHSLAIFEMENPTGCVHVMVEVDSVDQVGKALDRMKAEGVKLTGTLGRHANDHMVSFYMASPSGFMVEYGAEGRTVEDWSRYSPFQSTVNSFWGHDFSVGME